MVGKSLSYTDIRRWQRSVNFTELVDVFVVDQVFKSFSLHLPRLHVDQVPGGLGVSRGAEVGLLS